MILMLLNVSWKLASGRPPNKVVVAELMVPVETLLWKTVHNQSLQKTQSKKIRRSYGKLRRSYGKLRRNYGKLRRSYDVPFFDNSLQNIEILNNTCSTAQNLSGRLCKPAQLELYPSAPTSWNNGSTFLPMLFQLRYAHLGLSTGASHCTGFIRFHLEDHLNGSDWSSVNHAETGGMRKQRNRQTSTLCKQNHCISSGFTFKEMQTTKNAKPWEST